LSHNVDSNLLFILKKSQITQSLLISSFSISLLLVSVPRGLVLNEKSQQGQNLPSQFMKISQVEHLFCPEMYLLNPVGFFALYLMHIPLQTISSKI